MSDRRPSLDQTLMYTADVWARRSTCSKAQVGCVISIDTRILVQGYNGAPEGMPHCDHSCDCILNGIPDPEFDGIHHRKDCRMFAKCETAQHAERNAVAYAARRGIALAGATAHVTREPCLGCAWMLATAGIERIVYQDSRSEVHDGLEYLEQAGVKVEQWR